MIVLFILLIMAVLASYYYRSKAKEFESLFELSKSYDTSIDVADEIGKMLEVQGANGNWNYDAYMHGMYNGMEFCHSLAKGVEPKYREAPKKWIADMGGRGVSPPKTRYSKEWIFKSRPNAKKEIKREVKEL